MAAVSSEIPRRRYLVGDTSAESLNLEFGARTQTNPAIETKSETKQEEIGFETQNQNDSSLDYGVTQIQQEGKNGIKEVQYNVMLANGKEFRRVVAAEKVITAPVTQIVSVGTASTAYAANESSSASAPAPAAAARPKPRLVITVYCEDGTSWALTSPDPCADHGGNHRW